MLSNIRASDTLAENRYKQVYIRPVWDGGGSAISEQNNVPTVLNTESSHPYLWQSRANNSPRFWVVYILSAFQDSYAGLGGVPGPMQYDDDPESENITWASANNPPMTAGVLIYYESERDGNLANDWRARVAVHEVGHNLGLPDRGSANPADDGIMHGSVPTAAGAGANYEFIDEDAHDIRAAAGPQ